MADSGLQDLVARAQLGDRDAVGALYDRHYLAIFRYVRARVDNPERAEDLTSEIFKRMLTGLSRYRAAGLSFPAWLFRIAHNVVVDDYRLVGRSRLVGLQDGIRREGPGDDPAAIVEQQLTAEQAYGALAELEAAQRDVLVLRFLSGLSVRDVAQTLERSEDSVKALQRRGLAALRLSLAEESGVER
jgi:RNA polymerase sigma-70 factor (ECF subfamily)